MTEKKCKVTPSIIKDKTSYNCKSINVKPCLRWWYGGIIKEKVKVEYFFNLLN